MRRLAETIIIVVGYRNPDDIFECLSALKALDSRSVFEVVIAENGGVDSLIATKEKLRAGDLLQLVDGEEHCPTEPSFGDHAFRSRLARTGTTPAMVHVAAMTENLGYAGAINACLRNIARWPGWQAVWILNPDTKPMPEALWALSAHCVQHGLDMVGSRMCTEDHPDRLRSCGLKWSKFRGQTGCVGLNLPSHAAESESAAIEQQLDAPSGASLYVTRSLICNLGMMDERYFLYFEDLDWGSRAKGQGPIGYAHASVVHHQGGSTIGSARSFSKASYLATYLEFRNRILFVRKFYPKWLAWTVTIQVGHVTVLVLSGGFGNLSAALTGLLAGVRGETGRPDRIMARHRVPETASRRRLRGLQPN